MIKSSFHTLLASAVLTALLAFTPKATAETKSPHGLFELGGDAWTNPLADGMRLEIRWSDVQGVNEKQYDWSIIDTQLANAQTYNKQLGISLVLLSAPPKWLTHIRGVETYLMTTQKGDALSVVLPWNPIVQQKMVSFITQLCLRYDGLVDYIVMGGLGTNTEGCLPEPDEIALPMTLDEALAAWTDSANKVIDTYGAHLYTTPFVITASAPFRDGNAPLALTNVISRAATSWGDSFGILGSGQNAPSTTEYASGLIEQYSSTNPVGFQIFSPAGGSRSSRMPARTLQQTLDASIALGAQWFEISPKDADNLTYTATFESAKTQLASLSTLSSVPPAKPSATKAPHGTYEIGGDAWTNPGIGGWKGESLWYMANPSNGVYDWSKVDALVSNAQKYHKQLGISQRILSSVPSWVSSLPGVKMYKTPLGPDKMVLPWDPVAQPKILAFITAFCQHFDGDLDFVVMGGLGYKTETYMPLPSDIGLNMSIADYTLAWERSCNLFIDTYNQNLHTTPFVVAAGVPFNDPGANAAITTVINHGLLYPLFGLSQWGLKATSNNGFFLNAIIQSNDAGRATGFQLVGASDGSVGGDLQGTLAQALAAGALLGADWIEIYAVDAMNPLYAPLLLQYNSLLK